MVRATPLRHIRAGPGAITRWIRFIFSRAVLSLKERPIACHRKVERGLHRRIGARIAQAGVIHLVFGIVLEVSSKRSEERRVGRGWRCGGWTTPSGSETSRRE